MKKSWHILISILALLAALAPTRRSHLPITGFMWTPYLPVRDRTCLRATHRQAQTGTRRTSCHEPRNRNRDAAWRVTSALFRSKRRLSVKLPLLPHGASSHLRRNPPKQIHLRQGYGGYPFRIHPRPSGRGFLRRRIKRNQRGWLIRIMLVSSLTENVE